MVGVRSELGQSGLGAGTARPATDSVSALRQEIGASWDRSVRAGLRPERFEVPYFSDFDSDGQLVRAAQPVLDDLTEDLATYGVGVVLTDEKGQLLDRRAPEASLRAMFDDIMLAPGALYAEHAVGTNAIGTALEQGHFSWVEGGEHFAEELTAMTCAAQPITDLRSGEFIGVVDLSCAASNGSPLLVPLVRRAARDVERRLFVGAQAAERALSLRFAQERRRRGSFVIVGQHHMMANAAAKLLVDPQDEPALREYASAVFGRPRRQTELVVKSGTLTVTSCERVIDHGEVVGALIRFDPASSTSTDAPRGLDASGPASRREGLTNAESEVTLLVSQGMTNRQVAEALSMSPYTVDSHLRSIYRKLDVNSRVEMTRAVLDRPTLTAPGTALED
jgi:transcriptional regulator of acetoin/glycerol metabolism